MSMFGGVETKAKSCELNVYIFDKHPKFFKSLVQSCADGAVTGYGKRGFVAFIEPSALTMKDIEAAMKKNNVEQVVEIARSHIIRQPMMKISDWSRFTKSNDKEHLGNGNFKRITVKEVKGKNVVLDNGVQLTSVKNLSNVSIWKIVGSGNMYTSTQDLEKIDSTKEPSFDGSKKGGFLGLWSDRSADELLIEAIQFGFTRYANGNLKFFSQKHYDLLMMVSVSKNMDLLYQLLALTTTNGGPSDYFLALHMVCKSDSSIFKKVHKQATSTLTYSKGGCAKLIEDNWDECFKIKKHELNRKVNDNMKKILGKDCVLTDAVQNTNRMYEQLDKNNCLNNDSDQIYTDVVHKFLKTNPGFKAWSDYFRFYCDTSIMECEQYSSSNPADKQKECLELFGGLVPRLLVQNYKKETVPLNTDVLKANITHSISFLNIITFVRHGIPFFHKEYISGVSYDSAKISFKPTTETLQDCTKVRDHINTLLTNVEGGADDDSERVDSCKIAVASMGESELEELKQIIESKMSELSGEGTSLDTSSG